MIHPIGILLSGRGSNFLAIAAAVERGEIPARIACVLSDRADAQGLVRAREMGLDARFVDPSGRKRADYEEELIGILEGHGVELICLAGYMRILGKRLIGRYRGRILNIHPSLLPSFPGLEAQRQALEYGVRVSGCTVHFVDEGMDTGPIVAQTAVPVLPEDDVADLSARILEQEHLLYSEAIQRVLSGSVTVEGRRVRIG